MTFKHRKSTCFQLVLIRMFNTTFVGTGVPDCPSETGILNCPQQKNFGRDVVFSADLFDNGVGDEYG